ncbi:MAG: tetratricopeptide repeat protein [bacterium]|nr:tetratricopeptide repeat protein [bacterium]
MQSFTSSFQFLKEAYRSIGKKRYRDAIVMLQKVLSSYEDEPYPVFLLSVAYLYNNHLDFATRMLDKVRGIDPDYMPAIQLQAFLNLKSAATSESILYHYFKLLEKYPKDPYIYKGMKRLRRAKKFNEFQRKARLQDFVKIARPPKSLKRKGRKFTPEAEQNKRSFGGRWKKVLAAAGLFLLIGAAVSLGYTWFAAGIGSPEPGGTRDVDRVDELDMVTIGGANYELVNKINRQKVRYFYYSGHKMREDFNRAKQLIKREKHNQALVLLNRIYHSNANFVVKEKVDFLIRFVMGIDERDFEEIRYKDIAGDSCLYRGAALKWTGRVANLRKKNKKMTFMLLVDYREQDTFTGVAEIYSEFQGIDMANGDMVDIKGVFINTLGSNKRIHIVAREIVKL